MCLRESHRTRTAFRKVGGFVYVTTVLISLESRLGEDDRSCCGNIEEVLTLLHTVFNTLTVAMRFEPANAKFFHQEVKYFISSSISFHVLKKMYIYYIYILIESYSSVDLHI